MPRSSSTSSACLFVLFFVLLQLEIALAQQPDSRAAAVPGASDPASRAGTPAISGRDPGSQQEQDWTDGRWNATDVGDFLASSLKLPNGTVTKALSIRLGEHRQATVCFDTEHLRLRAGWTGGFLSFDPARFGLIHAPKAGGGFRFVRPEGSDWPGASRRFNGFRVREGRIVLEYQVEDCVIRESPGFANVDGLDVFIRSFEIGPSSHAVTLDAPPADESLQTEVVFDDAAMAGTSVNSNRAVIPGRTKTVRGRMFLIPNSGRDIASVKQTLSTLPRFENLDALRTPGPAKWLPEIETSGQLGSGSAALVIDTIAIPYQNPWNALMFLSGVGFTRDGTAYVCSIHGDVWKVSGIGKTLDKVRWKRFATGLYQPLGLQAKDDRIYVLGRDRITRLNDLNADGEADEYEAFCTLIETSPGGHDYVTSLECDAAGRFYYVDPRGVHRVSPDGRSKQTLATGFRNPNGLGVDGAGAIVTVAPQQGEWTPSSAIIEVAPGGYYGFPGPKVTPQRPLGYDPPLCWLPHSVDNSSGSQVWIPQGNWGVLGGLMLHFSWGRCGLMLVLRDADHGLAQGAVVPLPGRFLSGAMRGVFHPEDGSLHVVGSTGWQTSGLKDGCLQRVRYTGRPARVPVSWKVQADGISLTFSEPLDRGVAADPENYSIQQWNYRYDRRYGSTEWSVSDPGKEGRDPLEIAEVRLDAEGRTVFLRTPGLCPVMQLQIQYNLDAADGGLVRGRLYATVHRTGN